MDKLEYIPGDLVKFATNTYTIVNFEENFLHNKICYALISTNSTKTVFVADRDILPISITSDILKKNGWKKFKRPYSSDYCYRRKGYTTLNIRSEKEVYFHWGDHDKSITTVHQLQHLFFGLGLNSEMEV